ncbi:hypothetical protein KQI38_03010 [Tissierella carlieri]|nr:hypothetical protein [Tissierella carlieri]MBU5310983.1 hypothetical protein [Tissierella carlieri]
MLKKKAISDLQKAKKRQSKIDRLFAKMYEDRAPEKITERNFSMLSTKYREEQFSLEKQIKALEDLQSLFTYIIK